MTNATSSTTTPPPATERLTHTAGIEAGGPPQPSPAPAIHILPPLLVNQIAAGEVIERPASVVKELIENAIDAGASRMAINIERGGIERIEVIDDGCGIAADELALAVAPHATSKIRDPRDLDAISTLGFRGEALASIVSVARVTLISRTSDAITAMRLDVEGEVNVAALQPVPCGAPTGSTIIVRNLFFNTPARRKFLRTVQTEANHISELVQRLAMGNPAIGFTFTHDGKMVQEYPPSQPIRRRVLEGIGRELEKELIEINADESTWATANAPDPSTGRASIWGLIGLPSIARGSARYQYCYLNGRPIRDKTISHAVKEAYRGLLDHTKYPMVVLYLEVDPSRVDVNVHPTKAEVRFRDSQAIHRLVYHTVREALINSDLTPMVHVGGFGPSPFVSNASLTPGQQLLARSASGFRSEAGENDPRRLQPVPTARDFVDYFKRLTPVQRGFAYQEIRQSLAHSDDRALPPVDSGDGAFPADSAPSQSNAATPQPEAAELPLLISTPAGRHKILQVHSSYLVVEDCDGLSIIDQHALHERVMFEELKNRILRSGSLESQRLLMPAVIDVTRDQISQLESLTALLTQIGVDALPMGPTSIAVHGFPSFLFERGVDPVDFMMDLMDLMDMAEGGEEGNVSASGDNQSTASGDSADQTMRQEDEQRKEAFLHRILDMMSCKAAVKAGDSLQHEELAALLKRKEEIDRSERCPHGRPTTIRLTLRDLERQFGRR